MLNSRHARQMTVKNACVGAVVGLVIATPTCGFLTLGGSFIIIIIIIIYIIMMMMMMIIIIIIISITIIIIVPCVSGDRDERLCGRGGGPRHRHAHLRVSDPGRLLRQRHGRRGALQLRVRGHEAL
jgi:hypothetical protein